MELKLVYFPILSSAADLLIAPLMELKQSTVRSFFDLLKLLIAPLMELKHI